jgi:hypothetical protein
MVDCGLFSTAIVYGEDPTKFNFLEKKMRHHLIECFEKQNMSIFPIVTDVTV